MRTILNGYMGKILRVNLSTGKISTETLLEEIARKYVGGRGLSAKRTEPGVVCERSKVEDVAKVRLAAFLH